MARVGAIPETSSLLAAGLEKSRVSPGITRSLLPPIYHGGFRIAGLLRVSSELPHRGSQRENESPGEAQCLLGTGPWRSCGGSARALCRLKVSYEGPYSRRRGTDVSTCWEMCPVICCHAESHRGRTHQRRGPQGPRMGISLPSGPQGPEHPEGILGQILALGGRCPLRPAHCCPGEGGWSWAL